MEISRQDYWSGLLLYPLLQGIFLDPGIKPGSLALHKDSLLSEPSGKPVRFTL